MKIHIDQEKRKAENGHHKIHFKISTILGLEKVSVNLKEIERRDQEGDMEICS